MSLKKVKEVKAERGFKIWDLAVYGGLVLLIAALFIAVFVTRDTRPLKGIKIYAVNEVVYEYDFQSGEISRKDCVEILTDGGEALTVKITTKHGYNVVEIDKSGKVRVTQADCPKKDCIFSPEIKDNGGVIHCLAHGLKIIPYGYDEDNGNLIQ